MKNNDISIECLLLINGSAFNQNDFDISTIFLILKMLNKIAIYLVFLLLKMNTCFTVQSIKIIKLKQIPFTNVQILFTRTGFDYIFANVVENHRGYRHLLLDGYRFGVHSHKPNQSGTYWRCTAYSQNTKTRCCARVLSKIINGYEMVNTKIIFIQFATFFFRFCKFFCRV